MQAGLALNSMMPSWRRIQTSSRFTSVCSGPSGGVRGRSGGLHARTGPAAATVRGVCVEPSDESVKAGGVQSPTTHERANSQDGSRRLRIFCVIARLCGLRLQNKRVLSGLELGEAPEIAHPQQRSFEALVDDEGVDVRHLGAADRDDAQ